MPTVFRVHPRMGGGLLKRKFTTAFGWLRGDRHEEDKRRSTKDTKGHEGGSGRRMQAGVSIWGRTGGGRFGGSGCYELEGGEIQSG